MLLSIHRRRFASVLPQLLEQWPQDGHWSMAALETVQKLADPDSHDTIKIDTDIPRYQLETVGTRLAGVESVPWKYQKFLDFKGKPNTSMALKIRPGSMLPITINGVETESKVLAVRRLRLYGEPTWIKLDLAVDTKYIPIILESESRCTCLYCGTSAVSDEHSCRTCGAPLPPC